MVPKAVVWTSEDLRRLLNRIKLNIPAAKTSKVYVMAQKALDWKEISFSTYSPDECQAKWKQMFDKLRKQRTMTELVEEAESAINDPFSKNKHVIHPEFPKKPPIAHCLYLMENKAEFRKKHPDLDPHKMLSLATYEKKYTLLREQYDLDIIQFRQQYGCLSKKKALYSALKLKEEDDPATSVQPSTSPPPPSKRRSIDEELPDHPAMNGFMVFVNEQRAVSEPMAPRYHLKACSQRWKSLQQAERDHYNKHCKEKYSKATPLMFPGEPKKPSWTGASQFFSEKLTELPGDLRSPKGKFASVTAAWTSLCAQEKARYCNMARLKFHRYTLDLLEWFEDSEDEDYLEGGRDNDPDGLAQDILSDLVEDACLGLCFDVHRAVKQGYFFLEDTDQESMRDFEIVDQPGVDVFGQVYNQWKNKECVCPNCSRSIAASRFAPHLEKCLGMGRNSSRIANRRIVTGNTANNKSESDQEDNDDVNDNDWSYGAEKKGMMGPRRRMDNQESPRMLMKDEAFP
ncbi:hypothetical protein NHX12_024427 [Muraenolepis orangiensis]|uniref:Ataxin-7-like protein 3 n=1 Tax=Muraenolepis orangiensis TaxID=630683 RepID=A0A9Q0ISB2_9TELE|nr:hypothetical protein NHX12_024427 [Muraenolepis orangiensis]